MPPPPARGRPRHGAPAARPPRCRPAESGPRARGPALPDRPSQAARGPDVPPVDKQYVRHCASHNSGFRRKKPPRRGRRGHGRGIVQSAGAQTRARRDPSTRSGSGLPPPGAASSRTSLRRGRRGRGRCWRRVAKTSGAAPGPAEREGGGAPRGGAGNPKGGAGPRAGGPPARPARGGCPPRPPTSRPARSRRSRRLPGIGGERHGRAGRRPGGAGGAQFPARAAAAPLPHSGPGARPAGNHCG